MTRYRTCACGNVHSHPSGLCESCRPRHRRSPSTRAQRDGTGDYERARRRVLRLDERPVPVLPCHWCRVKVATTADHVVPVALGGSNALSNLVAACLPCNTARRADPNWRPPSTP